MPDKTEARVRKILRRTQTLRRRRETVHITSLTALCLTIFACIGTLLREVQPPGVVDVTGDCGTVLLHGGAELYVLVGILAFVLGAALTVLGIRWKNKHTDRREKAEKEEETE